MVVPDVMALLEVTDALALTGSLAKMG